MKVLANTLVLVFAALPVGAQDFAVDQLEGSPRHHDWIEISANGRTIHAFAAFPEREDDAPAVLVIHENRGLTDWVRSFADQVAAAGYLAVAPDLLSDFDDEHTRTRDFANADAARSAIYELDPNQVTADLHAVRAHVASMPSSDGRVVVAGFCWGGSQSFRFATNSDDIEAALVFYGTAPDDEALFSTITAPVYGFYGEDDQRVNATIPTTQEYMATFDNTFDIEIYEGAGHAFMRSGDDPNETGPNKAARDQAWDRLTNILTTLER